MKPLGPVFVIGIALEVFGLLVMTAAQSRIIQPKWLPVGGVLLCAGFLIAITTAFLARE